MMRLITVLIFFIALLVCESWGADFTGFWKGDCSDNFGVQIKPAKNQLYSVSFCGPGGCFKPGEWTPNTPIKGDSKYEIISQTKIMIESDIYIKCTKDPTWTVAMPTRSGSIQRPDCSLDTKSKDECILIGWITNIRKTTQFGQDINKQTTIVGPFRPVALINGAILNEVSFTTIQEGQPFWSVLNPGSKPIELISVGSFLDHVGEDHCVYYGSFGNANPPLWTLLSNKPTQNLFRPPTKLDIENFYLNNKSCVDQGDYPEEQKPPCVRPRLLALTDLNRDGMPEYWATEPYRWDTGLTVWENKNDILVPLLEVCAGCSD